MDLCGGKTTGILWESGGGKAHYMMPIRSFWLALAHTVNSVSLAKIGERDKDSIIAVVGEVSWAE